jgi:hypothetical protein
MPEVPVIMFSAYSDSSSDKGARSAGVSTLVLKFEQISVLLSKAGRALGPNNCVRFGRSVPTVADGEKIGCLHFR